CVHRISRSQAEGDLRYDLRAHSLGERRDSRKREPEVQCVGSAECRQVIGQTLDGRVATRLTGAVSKCPRIEEAAAVNRVAIPEVIKPRSKLLSEQRGSVARRSGSKLVDQAVVDRPTMRSHKRESVTVNRARHAGMAYDQSRAGIDVDLSIHAVGIREVMLIVVNELEVMFGRDIRIEPNRREPPNVLTGILELVAQTIVIVIRPDAAGQRAILVHGSFDERQARGDCWVLRARVSL